MPVYGNPLDALRKAFGQQDASGQGPDIWPMRPKQFQTPTAPPPQAPPEFPMQGQSVVEGPSMNALRGLPPSSFMERTPGGTGVSGNEWTGANQGLSSGVKALGGMHRSEEELYKQAANPTQTVKRGAGFAGSEYLDKPESFTMASSAPGASQMATRELETLLAPEDFQRELGQKQQETVGMAETSLHPAVQQQQEGSARRAAYPQQAQAQGAQSSALLNFLGRQETAQGAVESRQIEATGRHITAITTAQQRLLSDLATSEVPDEQSAMIMQRLDQMDKQKQALIQLQETYGLTDEDLDGLLGQDLDEFDTEDY